MGCPTCKSITLFKGTTGATGAAATLAAGSVTTLSPGASATVVNAGSSSAATFNFGIPQGATGATGSAGAAGAQGNAGGFTLGWNYDTGTGTGTSSGDFRFNHATPASVTALYINDTTSLGGAAEAFLNAFDNSSSFGLIKITKRADPSVFWMGKVTAESDLGSEHSVTVTYIANAGSFTNNDPLDVSFAANGVNKATLYAKQYTALITQAGTSNPVATVPTAPRADVNYLGDIVWTRTGTGVYLGTLSGAFAGGQTVCTVTQGDVGTPVAAVLQLARTSDDTVTLRSFTASTGAATDVLLGTANIEIKKYA